MKLLSRLRGLFRRSALERDMSAEMQAHLDLQTARHVAAGMGADEARYAAQRQFGNVASLQERARDQRSWGWPGQAAQDLAHAARLMRKSPGFTAVAVLTLALGLGANITVFSLISYFFFKPLAVQDASRLVLLSRQDPQRDFAAPVSWRDFQDFRTEVKEFDDALALLFRPAQLSLAGRAPDRTYVELVSGNYFSMLGVQPLHGRLFLPGEGTKPGADPIVVLGHDYWQAKLGGDPTIVDRTLLINGSPFRVVGIAPPTFTSAQWALLPSAFVPATMIGQVLPWDAGALEGRDWSAFKIMARLAPGATVGRAQAAVDVVHRRLVGEHAKPDQEKNVRTVVRLETMSRPDPSVARIMPFAAAVFMALVVLVLLIACANVANLLLARGAARGREMGIRAALGASRGRLTRQLLTENLLLALLAGATGFFLSFWSGQLLQRFAPAGEIPIKPDDRWDWNAVLFTLAASVLAGVVTSLVPALRATGGDLQATIKNAPVQTRRTRHWFRNGLVVSQVGFSVIVLVCGGLFVRSLRQLSHIDLGFRPERVMLASIDPGLNGYSDDRGRQLIDSLLTRVRALPGVEAATIAVTVPFGNEFNLRPVRRADDVVEPGRDRAAGEIESGVNSVEHGYLDAMGVTLLRGRGFRREDTATSAPVVVINETLARRLWPDRDAVGERVVVGWDNVSREVVGVARNGKYLMLGEEPRPYAYAPITQLYRGPLTLHVRAARGADADADAAGVPAALATAVRGVLRELDPALPVFNVRSMEEHMRSSAFGFLPLRFAASLASVQGALGLVLAVMGLYGVVAFSVIQRTKEIAVRVALGARPREVLRLVVRGGLRLTLTGLGLGLCVALALAQVLSRLLYGLSPFDGLVFGGVTALLLGVTLLACWLPARRAAKIDPMLALRSE